MLTCRVSRSLKGHRDKEASETPRFCPTFSSCQRVNMSPQVLFELLVVSSWCYSQRLQNHQGLKLAEGCAMVRQEVKVHCLPLFSAFLSGSWPTKVRGVLATTSHHHKLQHGFFSNMSQNPPPKLLSVKRLIVATRKVTNKVFLWTQMRTQYFQQKQFLSVL